MRKANVEVSIDESIATIRLNNPEQHNALSNDDLAELEKALNTLRDDSSVRVLIITGAGTKTFCSGAVLDQMQAGILKGNLFQAAVDTLEAFPRPTICALNGSVYGGGVELSLACDFRVGVLGSKLFVPPARLGLCYPFEGVQRFVSRLGLSATKRLLLANETFIAQQSNELGYYDYILPADSWLEFVHNFANTLSEFAPLAVSAMKQTINALAVGEGNVAESRAREAQCLSSNDLQEGLAALAEKRQPQFKGD